GGILILILFGVMLTHRDTALVRRARRLNIVVPGIAGGAILAAAAAAASVRAHYAVTAMTLASITPSFGPADGGTTVVINGANLAAVGTVMVGNKPLRDLTVSDSQIIGTTAPHHGKAE